MFASTALRIDAIPAEMQVYRQWVIMDIHYNAATGKWEKFPQNPNRPGSPAKINAPSTWGSFEQVIARLRPGQYPAFALTENDPYCFIDQDGCCDLETGDVDTLAIAIADTVDSYTERSVSGKGLHTITRGTLSDTGRKCNEIELYRSGRFVVMTGNVFDGHDTIEDRPHELVHLHAMYFAPKPAPRPSPQCAVTLAGDEILERAYRARNGWKTRKLYSGDWSGYGSQSEADAALCMLLGFWTQDPGQLDALFRASGLYREKWDERRGPQTYGERTIESALSKLTATYEPAAPPAVEYIVPEGATTDERLAALEARLAEAERRIARQAEVIETQKAVIQSLQTKQQAYCNAKLRQAAPTLIEIADAAVSGRFGTDEDGFARIRSDEIGRRVNLSDDSARRYLELGGRIGLYELKTKREWQDVIDKKTGEPKSVPVKSFWVKCEGTVEEQIQRIAEYQPEDGEKPRVVNKIQCGKHPDAKVLKFVTYKCGECGEILRPTEVESDPDGYDAEDPSPHNAVRDSGPLPAAQTRIDPCDQGIPPQTAVRTAIVRDWPSGETSSPHSAVTCQSHITGGRCYNQKLCNEQGRCEASRIAGREIS